MASFIRWEVWIMFLRWSVLVFSLHCLVPSTLANNTLICDNDGSRGRTRGDRC